jgi:lipid II:glycine glycyltransferase (peptidoglycan interpeptide bridge formation enzyme)
MQWDTFLEASPLGQFQQSSKWGRVKSLEGWKPLHVPLHTRGSLSGGYLLLWKVTRFGRIGYISKGPVLHEENPEAVRVVLQQAYETAKELRLRALIVQPPDLSSASMEDLQSCGFSDFEVPGVITATLVLDVSGGVEVIDRHLSKAMRNEARRAFKRGVTIQEGRRDDLPKFFQLMSETCVRQKTLPNPSRVELLQALWDEFQPQVWLRLASVSEEIIAGLLMIGFGDRLILWKKGWNYKRSDAHPNSLLHVDTLHWANAKGYKHCDFVGIDRSIAETILEGRALTEAQIRSRHMFNLRLGATPLLLPPAQILVVSPVIRLFCHYLLRSYKMRITKLFPFASAWMARQ